MAATVGCKNGRKGEIRLSGDWMSTEALSAYARTADALRGDSDHAPVVELLEAIAACAPARRAARNTAIRELASRWAHLPSRQAAAVIVGELKRALQARRRPAHMRPVEDPLIAAIIENSDGRTLGEHTVRRIIC